MSLDVPIEPVTSSITGIRRVESADDTHNVVDLANMEIYFEFSKETEILEAVQKDDRVSFNLGFTLAGPCAINVSPV